MLSFSLPCAENGCDVLAVEEGKVSVAEKVAALDMTPALEIVEQMSPVTSSDIIPLLQRLQEAYGYLPRDVVLAVAERTGLPPSRMFGVATFYAQFHLTPRGRHMVRCCTGTGCHVKGGKDILLAIQDELGIEDGGTTEDLRFTLEAVACLGTCFLSPVVMIDDDYHARVTPKKIRSILKKYP